jgi:hypothetical protein
MDAHSRARRVRRAVRSRLTATNAIACTALFLALGGGAYAASSSFVGRAGNINTCVPPNGGEVNVWKPGHRCSGGRVNLAFPTTAGRTGATGPTGAPGATGATGATGPANADAVTVDGQALVKLSLRIATPTSGTTTATLYAGNGLTVYAACDSTGAASLLASGPASADEQLTVSGYQSGASAAAFGSQTGALGPTQVTIAPGGSGEASLSSETAGGAVTSGQLGYRQAPGFGAGFGGCTFFGTVITG